MVDTDDCQACGVSQARAANHARSRSAARRRRQRGEGDFFAIAFFSVVIGAVWGIGWTAVRLFEEYLPGIAYRWSWFADCPLGSDQFGSPPPGGLEQWCQERGSNESFQRQGRARYWYASGQMRAEGNFVDGLANGEWLYWVPNGRLAARGQHHHGKRGAFVWFTPDGASTLCAATKDIKVHSPSIGIEIEGEALVQFASEEPEVFRRHDFLCKARDPLDALDSLGTWPLPDAK